MRSHDTAAVSCDGSRHDNMLMGPPSLHVCPDMPTTRALVFPTETSRSAVGTCPVPIEDVPPQQQEMESGLFPPLV